ncbi:MAG: hypothetical protein SAJ12_07765 [Jaaginema sp. PMC 1079.18]|nr:hypothetical protein [Jaaginema sp. PMC 1080.18]MEC4850895.1 hypothetical protein [Jaaginema sp. PMC 1079.18]MEC4865016.1 hypothetical protein [Jaaginema sp. PMC 1078.18]
MSATTTCFDNTIASGNKAVVQDTIGHICTKLESLLSTIARNGKLIQATRRIYGNSFNRQKLEQLCQDWENYHFESLPQIQICCSEEIHGLNSTFSPRHQTIYLAQEYICWKSTQTWDILTALLEAIGCFIDCEIDELHSGWGQGLILAESICRTETNLNASNNSETPT